MLQTVRAEKIGEKKWGHLSSFHVSFLSYGPYIFQKKCIFCNFALTSVKQFTCMHLKVLIILFQKFIWFIPPFPEFCQMDLKGKN